MDNQTQPVGTKQQLILAGLDELNRYGVNNFSTRRIAKQCGVSCAAPYKHFKDTQQFIAEIFGYLNCLYSEEQKTVLEQYAEADSRTQLLQVSLHYIRFLTKHPEFRKMAMQNYKDCNTQYRSLRGELSTETYKVVSRYCEDVQMPNDVRIRKTFIVRAIIYCAALFFDNGEMEYNEDNMQMVASMLDREFDLP